MVNADDFYLDFFYKKLCYFCLHSYKVKFKGYYCSKTDQAIGYKFYCPHFEPNKKKISNRSKYDYFEESRLSFFSKIFLLFFLLLYEILIFVFVPNLFYLALFPVLFVAFIEYYFYSLPGIVKKLGWSGYFFALVYAFFLENYRNKADFEKIIFQHSLILYGSKYFPMLKEQIFFFEQNFSRNKLQELLTSKSKHLERRYKKLFLLLTVDFQLFIKPETDDFALVWLVSEAFGFSRDYTVKLIEETKNYRKKFEKQRQRQKRETTYRQNKDVLYYLEVLGLDASANKQKITKRFYLLSKKYHPDKFVKSPEEVRKKMAEKYKEITEAYNFLKKFY